MKIAIVGNTAWQNKRKVQETISQLKSKFGSDVTVIGAGGSEGANSMVKKYAIEMGMRYEEYNPSFTGYNMYSAMPESYYGKSYHFSQLHHRMKLIAENADYVMILSNESKLHPVLETALKTAKKLEKPVVLLG
jgi:fructoselysine-6-P-deglycase FrlB-like protein